VDFLRNLQKRGSPKTTGRWLRKKLQMPGAQKLNDVGAIHESPYLQVRGNDEVEAQRRRWTFYEAIRKGSEKCL
jgi:hypothetical protein